jgi:IS30 family transposase
MEAGSEYFDDLAGAGAQEQGGVHRIVSVQGGIAPSARHRAAWTLDLGEREEVSRGIAAGLAIRAIARSLGRSPSTISREIARNGGAQTYRATRVDKQAWERALRPKRFRLACSEWLRWLVAQKLAPQWSPEQIAGWLRREYPGDPGMRISHEAIYRSLFIQSRGVLKKELTAHLRTRRQMRLPKERRAGRGKGKSLI